MYWDVNNLYRQAMRQKLQKMRSDLPFLPKRMNIGKSQKLVCNMFDKKNYITHIKALKLTLDFGLMLEIAHNVIKFNQETWFNPYMDMTKELKKKGQK